MSLFNLYQLHANVRDGRPLCEGVLPIERDRLGDKILKLLNLAVREDQLSREHLRQFEANRPLVMREADEGASMVNVVNPY